MKNVNASLYTIWMAAVLRWLLGCLFIWAGTLKLLEPQIFADRIASFQLPLSILINPVALGLPPLEIISGTLLIIGWQRRVATLSIVLLLAVFLVALVSVSLRGITVECGCFGDSLGGVGLSWAIVRDLILLAVGVFLYWQQSIGYRSEEIE